MLQEGHFENIFKATTTDKYFSSLSKRFHQSLKSKDAAEILKSPEGWEAVKNDFKNNSFPSEFDTEDQYDYDIDAFSDLKAGLIPVMFENNLEQARILFKE